jgi:two-component system LytT family response regulator
MTNSFSCMIVDDEPHAIELLTEQLSQLYRNIHINATCSDWEEALSMLRSRSFDLLFLDISLSGKNIMDLLKLLPATDSEIIFITAHEQYALEAFQFATSGYLLKPVSDAQLAQAVNKVISRIQTKRAAMQTAAPPASLNDKIGIPNKCGIDYVNLSDILYFESVNKCTKIVTAKTEYISLSPLIKFKALTDSHSFLQVHRSFIINLNNILRYESSGVIIMSNKRDIPIARSFRNDFLKRFNNNF